MMPPIPSPPANVANPFTRPNNRELFTLFIQAATAKGLVISTGQAQWHHVLRQTQTLLAPSSPSENPHQPHKEHREGVTSSPPASSNLHRLLHGSIPHARANSHASRNAGPILKQSRTSSNIARTSTRAAHVPDLPVDPLWHKRW